MATKNSVATSNRFRERKSAPEFSVISVVLVILVISVISVVPDVTVAGLHGVSRDTLHVVKYLAVTGMPAYMLSVQHPSLLLRSCNDCWQNALHVELATQFGNMLSFLTCACSRNSSAGQKSPSSDRAHVTLRIVLCVLLGRHFKSEPRHSPPQMTLSSFWKKSAVWLDNNLVMLLGLLGLEYICWNTCEKLLTASKQCEGRVPLPIHIKVL